MQRTLFLFFLLFLVRLNAPAAGDITYTIPLTPGTPAETDGLLMGSKTSLNGDARRAEQGGGWTYRVVVPPSVRCVLAFTVRGGSPVVKVLSPDGKPVENRLERAGQSVTVTSTIPESHPLGGGIRWEIQAVTGAVAVQNVRLLVTYPDRNNNGIGDPIERMMGVSGGLVLPPRLTTAHTAIQTLSPYYPEIAAPVDMVLSDSKEDAVRAAWREHGYLAKPPGEVYDRLLTLLPTGDPLLVSRTAGVRIPRSFEANYLWTSRLFQEIRGTSRKFWFDVMPFPPDFAAAPPSPADVLNRLTRSLPALLVLPDADLFVTLNAPEQVYEHLPAGAAEPLNTVSSALSEWGRYAPETEAGSPGIGLFVPARTPDFAPALAETVYSPALPFLSHGVPLQALPLERAAESGFLDRYKTLLVSFDVSPPAAPTVLDALVQWTKRGGSLIVLAETDAQKGTPESWWRKQNFSTPTEALFAALALTAKEPRRVTTDPDKEADYRLLQSGTADPQGKNNRRMVALDVTPFVQENGSISVRIGDATPEDALGAQVAAAELRIGGRLAAAFRAGSELETRFLTEEVRTQFDGEARTADRDGYWIYRFDNLPKNTPISLTLDISGGYQVKARSSSARTPLLEANATMPPTAWEATVVRLRMPHGFTALLCTPPANAQTLYSLRTTSIPANSGAVVWEAKVEMGNVMSVGLSPNFFSANAQASRWLRALVKRAYEKTGSLYREANFISLKRGPYLAIQAMAKQEVVEGRWVDLLKADLPLAEDPTLAPHTGSLFVSAGKAQGNPRLLALSGRLRAKAERQNVTGFLAAGPAKTEGLARLYNGKRRFLGVKAYNRFGVSVPATAQTDAESVLIRYPNDPDGVVVRVGWE